jgi:hypothetical protein
MNNHETEFNKLKAYDVVLLKKGSFGTVVYIHFPMMPNNIRILLWNSGIEKLISFSDILRIYELEEVYSVSEKESDEFRARDLRLAGMEWKR